MPRAFVDTWAWYALADRADRHQELAQLANEELLDASFTFITTNFVLDETLTLIRYNLGHEMAVQFWHTWRGLLDAGLVGVVRIDEALEAAAWSIFERYADQKFLFIDCTSFAVMQALGLKYAFTGDSHFAVLGFILVPTP